RHLHRRGWRREGDLQVLLKGRGSERRGHLRSGLRAGAERGPLVAQRPVLLLQEGRQGVHGGQGQIAEVGADAARADGALHARQGVLGDVTASTKVCTKEQAKKLASAMK